MLQNKKIKLLVNYFLGPLLFVWLSWSLYNQIKNQQGLQQAWLHIQQTPASTVASYLVTVFLLMIINWLIEAVKWKLVLRNVQQLSLAKAFKAVLSGVSFSATTPNRVGEYAGRVLFLDEGNRLRSVSLTIVCSLSQLIITIFMGCLGLIFLMNKVSGAQIIGNDNGSLWLKIVLYGSLAVLAVLGFFYFKISLFTRLLEKIPWLNKHLYLVEELEKADTGMLLKLLSLSLLRFVVFCVQYYLLFRLFDVEVTPWQSFWVISIAFLVLAVIPTIAVAELGLRGTITWELMKVFTTNSLGVTITTASIWFINLIIPAITGSLLIAGVKLFKHKKEAS